MSGNSFSVFRDDHFMDLTLYQYGREKCTPLHSFGPFVRNHFLFHYIISGKGVLYANDVRQNPTVYSLQAGCGFLIEPGLVNLYYADQEEPWEYIWLEFGGLRAGEYLEAAGLTGRSPIYTPASQEQGARLLEEMTAIVDQPEASPLFQIGHLCLFLDRLLAASSAKKEMPRGRIREFYVREAISFIEQNYSHNLSVLDMARHCRLERSYFGKIFRDVMGQSPQDFLIRYRMSKAAEALRLSALPVADIAASVGYANALHFSRAFKGIYGIPPREYRRQNGTSPA